ALSPGERLRELIHRKDRVLAVLHTPSAALARIMELGGCETGFVGTSGVVGAYTGLADVGTATMSECVTIAGWIAQTVKFPVIMEDGDSGHGGIMAVRRMVRECWASSNSISTGFCRANASSWSSKAARVSRRCCAARSASGG